MSLLIAEHLKKTYLDSGEKLQVLNDINIHIEQGDFACISGQSGCGKSTLLHLLGLLDKPDSGMIFLDGNPVSPDSLQAPEIRNRQIGFVFQFHYLMEDLTATENVALPLLVTNSKTSFALTKAAELLQTLNLGHRLKHYPRQLSGGEQQRVALARALINQPRIVLADEPTGNLDPEHSNDVIELMLKLNQDFGQTFVLVTHDTSIASLSKRQYRLSDGILHHIGTQ